MTSFRASRGAAAAVGLYGCQWRREPVSRGLSTGGRRPALICEGGGGTLEASLLQVALEEGDGSRRADGAEPSPASSCSLSPPAAATLASPGFRWVRPGWGRPGAALQHAGIRHPPPPRLLLHLMHFKRASASPPSADSVLRSAPPCLLSLDVSGPRVIYPRHHPDPPPLSPVTHLS